MTYSNVFEKYAYSLRICDVFDGIHWYSWYSSVFNTEYVIRLVFVRILCRILRILERYQNTTEYETKYVKYGQIR